MSKQYSTKPASGNRPDGLLRPLSGRGNIDSFIVMDVMSAAAKAEAAGQHVLHLEVGQPGTPAPAAARELVSRRMASETMGYTVALGLPELRDRIAQHYSDHYGVTVSPSRVVVTSGSSAGFVLAFLAAFDAGERVALPSPGYPCYRQVLRALNLQPVPVITGPDDRWMPTVDAILQHHRQASLAGVLIASPANPTGTMLEPARLEAIASACRMSGIWFISDEIYHGLSYRVEEQTALAFTDQAIVINSFSKYFSMTGWRVGWMVVPDAMVPAIERLTQNLYIAPPTVSQIAALGAFDARDELEANKRTYEANRRILMEGLPDVGLSEIVPADGAFYMYVDISRFSDDSLSFTRQMLGEIGIAATPGLDFDPERGGRYVRFSYAGPEHVIVEAVKRLATWDRLQDHT